MKLSVVVSVYNEEGCIVEMHQKLLENLRAIEETEIIYVNDGSSDRSLELLRSLIDKNEHPQIKLVDFARNFGHEAAMCAGILESVGDYIICLDADLQHPPHLIRKMLQAAEDGSDVVLMKRSGKAPSGILSTIFYSLWSKLAGFEFIPGASDFFLLSKKVKTSVIGQLREKNNMVRAIIQRSGFDRSIIEFEIEDRFSGESKYNLFSLFNLAVQGLFSYSKTALRISFVISLISFFIGIGTLVYSVLMFFTSQPFSGYTTIISFSALMFSFLFLVVGILSEYIGLVYDKLDQEPKFIVKDIHK